MPRTNFTDRPLDLQRAAITKSPSGAAAQAFATYAAAVLFAVAPASDAVVHLYAKRDAQVDYTLWTWDALPPGTVRVDDVAADPATGERFKVLTVKRFANGAVCGGAVLTELHCTTLND